MVVRDVRGNVNVTRSNSQLILAEQSARHSIPGIQRRSWDVEVS